ncbi:MAG: HYR domain-containing protein, partial [Verrucomicrobia bacterium]|nr:HYR domain-containing protein [Verrucomicrobiota bacterium]
NPPTWTNACIPPAGTVSNGVVLSVVSTVTNGTCPWVITRTWLGVDDCGNQSQCSQTVTVVDTTPPVLSCACLTNSAVFPPVPLTVIACTSSIPDLCFAATYCATDNCGPPTCKQSPPAGTIVGPGSYPITVTVTDCASNSASCVLNFTVTAPAGGCTPSNCITPPFGMVAWWPLDELNGAALFVDATGNGHTAIVESGGPVGSGGSPSSWPVGKVAGANYFYGLSSRGRALNVGLNFNTNSFSVDCWVNPVQTGSAFWHPILDKLNQTGPGTGFGYAVGILNTKVVLKAGAGPLNTYASVGSVTYAAWNFVAVVVDRTAGTVTFHVNGVTEPPQPLIPAGSFNSTVDLLIGSTYNGSIGLGELAVDELELFNRTLTTNEMKALWIADSLGKCKTNLCIASIFCPNDIVTNRTCTQACVTVTYPAPLFTNGVLAGCAPPSGICFPLGATTVTCTATNTCGQPASCSFTITVNAATNCQPCDYTLAHRLYSGTAAGSLLPMGALEPLWVNTASPSGPTPMVVIDTNLWPIVAGPWLAPSAQSAWVGPNTSAQGANGWYTNRWTFDAPCTNVCLRGRFATDDDGYLYVNGALVAGPSAFTAWTPVYDCGGFSVGPNTIELVVHNAGGPTGFRTELEIWTQCCCPSQTNIWNTGMAGPNGNVPLSGGTPDPNYTLVSQPPGGCTGPAQVLLPSSLPVPPWVANGPNSQWIGAGLTANCQGGVYHYRLCFYLSCTD